MGVECGVEARTPQPQQKTKTKNKKQTNIGEFLRQATILPLGLARRITFRVPSAECRVPSARPVHSSSSLKSKASRTSHRIASHRSHSFARKCGAASRPFDSTFFYKWEKFHAV
ncbi:hypothetical protein V9T40_010528 [Parthenolecanium corni]|uniref:Uncharacterized protein n=1 Tax=Parthenolecanium corni TaxID=536013 RepID=A0AAN9TGW4_9HEMI